MADLGTPSPLGDLGKQTANSLELHKRNLQHTLRSVQTTQSGAQMENISSPQAYSDLGLNTRDTPLGEEATPKPSFTQSSVYPQRLPKSPNFTPSAHQNPSSSRSPSRSEFFKSNPSSGTSPSRKLQEVFQQEGARLDRDKRISSLVQSIENEMHQSGINVNFKSFSDHLMHLQEDSEKSTNHLLNGEFIEVGCDSPRHIHQDDPQSGITEGAAKPSESTNPKKLETFKQTQQPKTWASLLNAQAPSKSLKLEHYPELQKGKEAYVVFDESQLDDGFGNHCLVGHFLDGKMPLPLLSATARAVWKDSGRFTIKQLGSCFLFEFEDEGSKLKVLEQGPYFFSRRYLVLKEWKRMLVPSKIQPTSIPVWIKLHRLPLEFWTPVGFSKIASAIGKPLHVDEATAKKKRLDFARICIEIDANDELPNDITISVNSESVMVGVEYQWLPPTCDSCKVFGHSCSPKAVPKTTPNEEWVVVGKGKLTTGAPQGDPKTSNITHPQAQTTAHTSESSPTQLSGVDTMKPLATPYIPPSNPSVPFQSSLPSPQLVLLQIHSVIRHRLLSLGNITSSPQADNIMTQWNLIQN